MTRTGSPEGSALRSKARARAVIMLALAGFVAAHAHVPSASAAEPRAHGASAETSRAGPLPGDRMVRAGVGVLVAGIAGYGLLGAGLGLGSNADDDLASLAQAEDIERRREVMDRGRLGNRLAIAGGVLAAVSMAVGIPLVVVGRRRHLRAMSMSAVPLPSGAAVSLRMRW